MLIEQRIVDYLEHKPEIDKWVSLKGEKKYLEYAKILENKGIVVTWKNLDDLFRYDKRLLINLFKYLSFFEDYLRAIVWNNSDKVYKKIAKSCLGAVIEEVLNMDGLRIEGFDLDKLRANSPYIIALRNYVAHNKMIIACERDGKDYKEMVSLFAETLPRDYQNGFGKDIQSCSKGLLLDERLVLNTGLI